MSDNILEHYGKKGMKWGITTKSDGTSSKTSVSSMSDKSLKAKVNRLNMEKQYIDLTNQKNERDKSTLDKGKAEVNKMLVTSGKQLLQPVVTKGMSIVAGVLVGSVVKAIDTKVVPWAGTIKKATKG